MSLVRTVLWTCSMRRIRRVLVLLSLLALAVPATAKPSDWADVIEKPGEKSTLPSASKNAPQVVTKASTSKPAKVRAAKTTKKAKAKKAPRRGKGSHSRR